ncbi:threonine/serine exporter family protein [Psychrobacillus lasiicapitis]|uniref:Threonine/serine exporter family protein n=1 Tax=Psychrobacillus lasiicapitis TaxID=1636719 RepID=A0A544TC86_9BACI|nr:threonine/serine exporter family protein [Psychrobacillus lasiicapitis]TQR15072.1 threonine/serine exporter family protein [Psychrobacillus lasiicapitis]GGA22220.1 membrane protein [Psychrobacillus lasiicapitis]
MTQDFELAVECCLLAGRLMMESGAETYRAEDTMDRMAISQHLTQSQSFVTPTGIIFSGSNSLPTRLVRISNRSTDLERIALVNNVSRKLVNKDITLQEAYSELVSIENEHKTLPLWIQIGAASIASASFLLLYGGTFKDVPTALIAGGIGFSISTLLEMKTRVKFFAEFLAALCICLIAIFSVTWGLGIDVDRIIIGSVMPLVPGLLITNAVRDLMAGHFVSGVSKGAEAFLTAFAIGAGVALGLSF